jgi:hypothetical protein
VEENGSQFLIDSSVWLERLLQQERDDEVKRLLDFLFDDELAISEFSLYSIGIIAMGNDRGAIYRQFLQDLFVEGNVTRVRLAPPRLVHAVNAIDEFGLDFDDAYQYVAAKTRDWELVSFDDDFDDTDLDHLTPQDVLDERV